MAIHFTKKEFTERKSKTIQELKKQGLDALLMFRQESMYWLTGYDTMGFVFFQCLILTTKGDVVLLTRAPDLRQAQNTSIIDDIRIWIDKDKSNPTNELKNILLELGLEKSNLGVEYEAYGLTGRNAIKLNNSLKNFATLHDKSELISCFRTVKSPAEIVYVKKAAELADKALDEVWKIVKPGVSEAKILAEMQKVVFEGGGDYPANEFIVGSGHNALLCRYQSEKRILSNPDQLTIEWAGTFKHYHSAMMRTIPIGKANPKHFKMHEACLEALSNCEKKLKPGNKVGDVFDTHAETFDKLGFKRSRMNACGYSLGTTFAPNWMDWPMLYTENPYIIQPGNVFFMHMILMDSENQLAMNLGETYLVKQLGNERLGKKKLELVKG
ncbi:MAG: Xaa-Pro peptidase family protein [Pelagibacteraceae bacterium]|jgi:Xaa-Pro dipeptidase|nr:Xaa-Pro dipeptidase [Candidatus Pelagibacter sp.]MDP6710347.1 Xaa-Pro peptidase family protein [Pelagibacteraceae bacterium]|tara:strand:- start:216 stop:1367 length:1152 start_codon:yes stop_codon:yes gene_type:complete